MWDAHTYELWCLRVYLGGKRGRWGYRHLCLSCCDRIEGSVWIVRQQKKGPRWQTLLGWRSHHAEWWAACSNDIKERDGTGWYVLTGHRENNNKTVCQLQSSAQLQLVCRFSFENALLHPVKVDDRERERRRMTAFKGVTLEEREKIPIYINSGATRIGSKRRRTRWFSSSPWCYFFFSPCRFAENPRQNSKGTRNSRGKRGKKTPQKTRGRDKSWIFSLPDKIAI